MNEALELLLSAEPIATATAASAAVVIVAMLVSVGRFFRYRKTVRKLGGLFVGGQAHEARIQARQKGGAYAPLLTALANDLRPPERRSWGGDAITVALTVLAPIGLLIVGRQLAMDDAGTQTANMIAALMVGFSALVPLSILGAVTVIHLHRRSQSDLRAVCIDALAHRALTPLDPERRSTLVPPSRTDR